MNETNLSLKYLIDQLHKEQTLTKEEWITLIEGRTPELSEYLFSLAREERGRRHRGHNNGGVLHGPGKRDIRKVPECVPRSV